MKSLIEIVNAQTEPFIGRHFPDMKDANVRIYHLDNNCIWRNSDLHIPVSDIERMKSKDFIVFRSKKDYYKILRMDHFAEHEGLDTLDKLKDFLRDLDKLYKLRSVFNVSEDFNYKIVYNSAVYRSKYNWNYICRYGRWNQYEVHGNQYEVHDYRSKQEHRPIEDISVDGHRKCYENKEMTLEEVSNYLEFPVSRVKSLSHCPGFPLSKNGRPRKISLAALNSWLSENPELFLVRTGALVEYMARKSCLGR